MEVQDRDMTDVEEKRPLSTADLADRAEDPRPETGSERSDEPAARSVRDIRDGRRDGRPDDQAREQEEMPHSTTEDEEEAEPLFPSEKAEAFQSRWTDIQTRFVDEPRDAVQAADSLVAELMKELAEGFARVRSGLEGQWDRGDEVSTEELRVALQRYRAFFNRLLAA